MSYFNPYGHQRGPGLMETLFGWTISLIILLVAFGFLIQLLIPLLPWIGAALFAGVLIRWYLLRMERW